MGAECHRDGADYGVNVIAKVFICLVGWAGLGREKPGKCGQIIDFRL
jgi:hypothetical protein